MNRTSSASVRQKRTPTVASMPVFQPKSKSLAVRNDGVPPGFPPTVVPPLVKQ